MALYALSDLHLSNSITNKPMDVFGPAWENHMSRIKENWSDIVKPEDSVLIPGDISWATYLEDCAPDFEYIQNLPGTKYIVRGNHDYWWATKAKIEKYLTNNGFDSIKIIQNEAVVIEDNVVTGTRGWILPSDSKFKEQPDRKIYDREVLRLQICLSELTKADPDHTLRRIVMFHFPPVLPSDLNSELIKSVIASDVDLCLYGHLHGLGFKNLVEGKVELLEKSTELKCVSGDFLKFKPLSL